MNRQMSPETNAVVECVRAFLRPSEDASLRAALAPPLDWDALERIADDHSVMPLVAYVVALREFHDLDLMVHSEDVLRVRDVLVGDGYSLWSPLARPTDTALVRSSNRQVCFTNKGRGMSVDLHWGALHEMFSFQLDVDKLWQMAYVERHEGVSFLSLSPEHLLLYLCAHGAKHCWRNLCWLCDIACHIQSVSTMDWDECIRLAELTGCGLLLKHTLLLSEEVLELQLPAQIKRYVDDDRARVLAETAQAFLLREHGDHPGYLGPLRYHLALSKGWRNGASLDPRGIYYGWIFST
jgi:hypothetical protein